MNLTYNVHLYMYQLCNVIHCRSVLVSFFNIVNLRLAFIVMNHLAAAVTQLGIDHGKCIFHIHAIDNERQLVQGKDVDSNTTENVRTY